MMSDNHLQLKYKRILLKCSGEALMGKAQFGIDPSVLDLIANDVAELIRMGVEVGLVIGGGNLFRGKALSEAGLGRVTGDHMGMLATVMNALAMRDALERIDMPARIMSAIPMLGVVDPYHRRKAITHLRNGHVVIFAAGTGNPFFTTDSAACLRAIEVGADIVLKATKVDGIYNDDPMINPKATRYDYLSYRQVLSDGLKVMDSTAICLCMDHGMPLQVFDLFAPGALKKIVSGERVGTIVGANND
ncbi:uridylate kinase [Legionella quinlivanii]|uniref:Uridylate kinase n=1 Tax=Legionella quinlivanii TaxID=45073 RepID=A0A0W0Y407_9GAMM|nr:MULTISPECIES: UMP kinase [Legionella]KTD51751.1 uridylate kinase [Legionella quinlivanii]MCE3044830.1 UMP kinase [Legionella sp. 16cNR16C]MCW8451088.1 UMP kinase [Legionella quinlivanii]SEF65189.1 uridylate kinase [Legionella quinlivanii DSM 21216]STY10721.1 uridylate kinase [Legionella quinlivanii]